MKYFYLDSSPVYKDKYIIRINHEGLPFPNGISGSYNVLVARLLSLSYAQYLRYCRDRLGAELIGRNKRYVVPYFNKNETTEMFVKLLNTRMKYIINEYNYPFDVEKQEDGTLKQIYFDEEK